MPRRPNYRFERAERDRAKKAKKEEKLLKRQQEHASSPEEADSPAEHQPDPAAGC